MMRLMIDFANVAHRFHQVAVATGSMNEMGSSGAEFDAVVRSAAVIVATTAATNSGLVLKTQRLAASGILATASVRAILSRYLTVISFG